MDSGGIKAFCRTKLERFRIPKQIDRANFGGHRFRDQAHDPVEPGLTGSVLRHCCA